MEQPSSFLNALFDFSFTEFVTTKLIKVLFGLGIFFAAISALSFLVGGFTDSFGKGLLFLILSPLVFIVITILVRVYLEVVIVLFRIAEHVSIIAKAEDKSA